MRKPSPTTTSQSSMVVLKNKEWSNVFSGGLKKKRLYGVTAEVTSPIIIKKSFRRHRVPDRAIKFALYCMDNCYEELTLVDIVRLVNHKFGLNLSRNRVFYWKKKFRPHMNYKLSREHDTQWNQNISNSVKSYYSKINKEVITQ